MVEKYILIPLGQEALCKLIMQIICVEASIPFIKNGTCS